MIVKLTNLMEGRYDKFVTNISWQVISTLKSKFKTGCNKKKEVWKKDIEIYPKLLCKVTIQLLGDPKSEFALRVQGLSFGDEVEVVVDFNTHVIPQIYEKMIVRLKRTLRHEIEHYSQYIIKGKKSASKSEIVWGLDMKDYFIHPNEIPAFCHGLYKEAKMKKEPLDQVMYEYLYLSSDLTKNEIENVMIVWLRWVKKNLPAAQLSF